jgi:hypothetical protein
MQLALKADSSLVTMLYWYQVGRKNVSNVIRGTVERYSRKIVGSSFESSSTTVANEVEGQFEILVCVRVVDVVVGSHHGARRRAAPVPSAMMG